ncbi:MAG: DUF5723 family protein [Prevotellaceae bacterium]|nr:DUF5723 family protein [Prevotellaceae bacterium]
MKTLQINNRAMKTLALTATLALGCTTAALAQDGLRSAYFLDGYTYQHRMNPAIAGERNYVSFPFVLGNINAGAQSNVGVSSFLYKLPSGQLTTFMNESVNASSFLSGLKGKNEVNADLTYNIMSAGFFKFGGFNTVELNLRSSTSTSIPKDMFAFMKQGMTSSNTFYDIGDLGLSSMTYAEIAFGHSRKVLDNLNVGAKVKVLVGLAQASVKMKDLKVRMTDERWEVQSKGEMAIGLKGLDMPSKAEAGRNYDDDPSRADLISWDDVDMGSYGLNGGGLAFDLGATYKFRDDLEFSAAITDLGFIKWGSSTIANTADDTWTFDGFHEVGMTSGSDNQIDDQMDDLGDELADFFNFHKTSKTKGKARALGATLTLGALYTPPFYDGKLKGGFLWTTRIKGSYSWTEGRFSANWFPCKVFDMSLNYAASNFGSSLGWVANVHTRGINFFLGTDHQFLKITPQFVPVHRANTNVSIGINFPFGDRKSL